MKVLELFSGVGGMHMALKESGVDFDLKLAVDINEVANKVYSSNFQCTKLLQKNIQSLNKKYVDDLKIDCILMSPPCQPFTRLGNKKDVDDKRCCALSHLTKLIPELVPQLKFILLENVKGFEDSEARNSFVKCLQESNFEFKEFLLNPLKFGIPNTRLRYYLVAKRKPLHFKNDFIFDEQNIIKIDYFLELNDNDDEYNDYLLPMDVLEKRIWVLDIVGKNSQNSCCFTKSYGRYLDGTGSFYSSLDSEEISHIRSNLKTMDIVDFKKSLEALRLRYFTPEEVKRLMCFSKDFNFPDCISRKQCYSLLGNSVNVKVVSELVRYLIK